MPEWIIALVSIFAVFGNILNVKRMPVCFIIWALCNLFWLVLDLTSHSYSRSALDAVNLCTSSWGILSWLKGSSKKRNKSEIYENSTK